MSNAPFIFGKTAESENFTDREQESEHLGQNFRSLINTAIISPRRWGKSSLVKRVAHDVMAADKGIKVCLIDLFNVRNEGEFYLQLATGITKSTSSKWEEWLAVAKETLSHLRPQITLSADMSEEISFDVGWEQLRKGSDEILDLPEKVAQSKDISIVVCIDEFQSIAGFADTLAFQRKLRSHWQNHQHVCYCLYGSRRHMLMDIFSNPSLPFYHFGDIMLLDKIANADWGAFIVERFATTDKSIAVEDACYLADLVDNHSYYVQQLAQQSWLRTDEACDTAIIDEAMANLVDQLSLLFTNTTRTLSAKQLAYLKAVICGEARLSSMDVLKRYGLGTSATVSRSRTALEDKEVIDTAGQTVEIADPVFKRWLARDYFKLAL